MEALFVVITTGLPRNPVSKGFLSSMGSAEEAYNIYQDLLREFPNADKKDIYERLAKVAMRLKKTSEAAEFERLAREQKI